MASFITGIAPTNDVAALEEMLGSIPDIDRAKLTVITTAPETGHDVESKLNVVHVGGHVDASGQGAGVARAGSGMMTGFGGTSVPGIGSGPSSLGLLGAAPVTQQLGTLPIPADEVANYNDALQSKRCVIAYECTDEDRPALEAAFRNAGIRHVKTFIG